MYLLSISSPVFHIESLYQEDSFMSFSNISNFLSSRDLVSLGLYPSTDAVYLARVRGNSPDFIKLGRKVLYPRESVMRFVQERIQQGAQDPKPAASVTIDHAYNMQ